MIVLTQLTLLVLLGASSYELWQAGLQSTSVIVVGLSSILYLVTQGFSTRIKMLREALVLQVTYNKKCNEDFKSIQARFEGYKAFRSSTTSVLHVIVENEYISSANRKQLSNYLRGVEDE